MIYATAEWLKTIAEQYASSIHKNWYYDDDPCLEEDFFDTHEWNNFIKEKVVEGDIKVQLLDHREHQDYAWVVAIPIKDHSEWSHYCLMYDRSFMDRRIVIDTEDIALDKLASHISNFLKTSQGNSGRLSLYDMNRIIGMWLEYTYGPTGKGNVSLAESSSRTRIVSDKVVRECAEILGEMGLYKIIEQLDNPWTSAKWKSCVW